MSNRNFNKFESINENENDDGFTTIINNKRSSYKMILEDYRKGKISLDNAEKMLNTKKTYNNNYNRDPHFRVTKNGMIALYNIAHKPLVLYANQWEKLGNFLDCNDDSELYQYIQQNEGRIKKIPNNNNNSYNNSYNST